MAISREAFERGDFKERIVDRTNHPVLKFLRKMHRSAWLVKEIVAHTKKKEETVRSILGELIKDGSVIHKKPFFIAKVNHKKTKLKKKQNATKRKRRQPRL